MWRTVLRRTQKKQRILCVARDKKMPSCVCFNDIIHAIVSVRVCYSPFTVSLSHLQQFRHVIVSPKTLFFLDFLCVVYFLFAFCSYAAERLTSQATVHSPLTQTDVKPTTLRVTCKHKRDSSRHLQ